MPRSLRIGLAVELAPRKRGSIEDWLLAFAREATARGHRLTLFCHEPMHPILRAGIAETGTQIEPVEDLVRWPVRAIMRFSRSFDIVHLNLFAPRDKIPLIAYAAWPCRVVFVDHMSGYGGDGSLARRLVRSTLDSLVVARTAAYVGVSRYVGDRAVRRFPRMRRHRVIYNGVDDQRFGALVAQARVPKARLLCIANLIEHKGVDILLKAVAQMSTRDVVVDIVGDGPLEPQLVRLAESLSIGRRVRFLGLQDDVPSCLAQADIAVHPCVWQEAFGLSVVEAMSAGVPVIASNTGAMPELLADGACGVLVPPGDPVALGEAIDRLLAEPDRGRALAAAARRRVTETFRLTACVSAHLDCCEEAARRS